MGRKLHVSESKPGNATGELWMVPDDPIDSPKNALEWGCRDVVPASSGSGAGPGQACREPALAPVCTAATPELLQPKYRVTKDPPQTERECSHMHIGLVHTYWRIDAVATDASVFTRPTKSTADRSPVDFCTPADQEE
ncbi:hypothetical protein UY3_03422 [Chelonia mydas]|uniref:Uncharacterized protein n=1 Tax=Chelonia mydas TaxID=8469 RepID=M7BUA2_CHEMY|nr:hypothetical protein UY3_03422 [Chelonia mydas]